MIRISRLQWCLIDLLIIVVGVPAVQAQDAPRSMRFEAEEISQPADAWQENQDSPDRWNLWSTDVDAERKWSGGVVLRSPAVMADRERPEDGAPPLHSVVTDLPPGRYVVEIGLGRVLAVSLDGVTWRRQTERRLGEFDLPDGRFELWVDDRYALSGESRGPAYYDYLLFIPVLAAEHGVQNGGFEVVDEGVIPGWTWWCRGRDAGTAQITDEQAYAGKRSCLIEHHGERDFALSNLERVDVAPRDKLTATAWVRTEGEGALQLAVVAMSGGEVVAWSIGSDQVTASGDWTRLQARALVRRNIDQVYVRLTGTGQLRAWVDDVRLERGWPPVAERADRPPVEGWATERVTEPMGRGLVAVPIAGNRVYLSWRLLEDDPADVGFDVYRRVVGEGLRKLNAEPITRTCDFIDENPVPGVENAYAVRAVTADGAGDISRPVRVTPSQEGRPWVSIPLQGDYTFQKVGIADLNGDGRYDFVIKQPNENIDPYEVYWKPSPDTYKLEAYLADGTFLWRRDLGWGIERGIWYSPFIVHDLDGDGRAEVAVKTGPDGDPRDEDGRVTSGPEWLTILDGMTGEALDQVAWPSREGFSGYNTASRNLMCVAYLDGKTPCIVVDRGTYGTMKVVAYQFHDGRLEELWRWQDRDDGGMYRGQGAHSMHAVDVDGDGRDEVFLGSSVLDDNGVGLWSTGMGHCDHHYVGDIDPTRPGLEVYYGYETRQSADGCCMVDAATGEWLWGLDEPTRHVHASGLCADIDARYPGSECYSGERDFPEKKWLWSAQGELIEMTDLGGLSPRAVYWDADLQRELVRGERIFDYRGGTHADYIQGRIIAFADILGDWREELIATLPGELRIYTTTIPAEDRRVCLMQDHIYRMDVAIQAMGYTQCPMLSYCPSAGAANLALVVAGDKLRAGEQGSIEVVVTAPADRPLRGNVTLQAEPGIVLGAERIAVDVPAGQVGRYAVALTPEPRDALFEDRGGVVTARYEGEDDLLTAQIMVEVLDEPLLDTPRTQAEEIAAQGGGAVRIRDDKVGADGLCFSHWDAVGHWIEWTVTVPESGEYLLAVRYCATERVRRAVAIDGRPVGEGEFWFPATGGFSSERNDWRHEVLRGPDGEPAIIELAAGAHTLRMTNVDGKGMNMDYLLLLAAQ